MSGDTFDRHASVFFEAVTRRAQDIGYELGAIGTDDRLDAPELAAVRSSVQSAVRFDLSDGTRSGRLAVWETASLQEALALTEALHHVLDREGDGAPLRFYLCGPDYLLLDNCTGWTDSSEIDRFLAALVA